MPASEFEVKVAMDDSPSTRSGLLLRLRDSDDKAAWCEFVELYAPLLYRYARHQGLQDADAADLTQDVLKAVALAAREFVYDRRRGRFRTWLYTIARNQLSKYWRDATKRKQVSGTSKALSELADDASNNFDFDLWGQDYDDQVFRLAAQAVRKHVHNSTWDVFWKTAVENVDPAKVAKEFGMSVGAVYIAKSRVLARLRQEIDELRQQDLPDNSTQTKNP